jgi:hypothetical protein
MSQRLDIALLSSNSGHLQACYRSSESDVPTVANSHISWKIRHMLLRSDNLSAKAISFSSVDFASLSACGDSTRILTSVLKDWEPVVDVLDSRSIRIRKDAGDDPTHSVSISKTLNSISKEGMNSFGSKEGRRRSGRI